MGGKGSGGHNKKPTELRKAEGNRGRRAFNGKEPESPPGPPDMPLDLSADARIFWDRLAPLLMAMKVLKRSDGLALEGLCEALARRAHARRIVERFGEMITEKTVIGSGKRARVTTKVKTNPMVRLEADADRRVRSYMAAFGLDPASRSRLMIEDPGDNPSDPLEDVIRAKTASDIVQ